MSLTILCFCYALSARAQTIERAAISSPKAVVEAGQPTKATDSEITEVHQLLREQGEELRRLRETVTQQSHVIDELRERVAHTEAAGAPVTDSLAKSVSESGAPSQTTQKEAKPATTDERLARVEAQAKKTSDTVAKQIGNITFSGDLRFQYDTILGQLNATANNVNPAILGNQLSARERLRLRARLAMRGEIGKSFEWGLRFSTGDPGNVISSNQVLTDFYSRKQFALDQAYLTWKPQRVPGLRLQGGKFETPWTHTELTFDNDIQSEGLNESYSRDFKKSRLQNLTFVAWQLPFIERNAAFIRNASNEISINQSRRAGRDLDLYGAQVRTRFLLQPKLALTLSATDLYYSGTQFITPVQFFGNQVQLPVTVTIPATANTPAQTVTGQALIGRELLVAGNGNLGISSATNNALNRDGRLASGYNLIDLIGRLDVTRSKRFPLSFIFNYVTNTQAHDVVTAAANGADVFQRNRENNGYWTELSAGKTAARGDFLLDYTFIRIEKDAVLTPFNFSEIAQQSDVRVNRFYFTYVVDPRVLLTATGIVSQRANGLLGPFGATPSGSLNRPTVRLQFDTTFRF
ncbi:MAG: putative porin [Pyrinomonadaceae bacterium]